MNAPNDLHALCRQRGGQVYGGGRRWVGPGPGHSRQDASLSVSLTENGRALIHSFAGDSFADCASYLGLERAEPERVHRGEWLRRQAERRAAERERVAADISFAATVWSGAQHLEGTPAETYLYRRGLLLEGCDALRWHFLAPRSKRPPTGLRPPAKPHGAMVAAVRDVAGKLKGVHLTYITADGRKAFGDRSRLMFGAVSGCSVQLAPLTVHGVLCVGEGIETSASFADFKGVPTWAALSTSGLQNFTPPAGVRKLLIAADSDDAGAGLKAATALAQRLRRSCDVEIHPAPAGFDWNDPEARAGHD